MNADRFSPVLVIFISGLVLVCGAVFAEAVLGWFVRIAAVIR